MKIAVIGGGFSGLSCALALLESKTKVVVFESRDVLGGLAGGFNPGNWRWYLDFFYHHIFTNDKEIIKLAREVGWPVRVKNPVTTSFINNKEIQLDTPLSVLRFSQMSLWGRLRMGIGLALLKVVPDGKFLEKYQVVKVLPKLIGAEAYQVIWGKMVRAKFGPYADRVNMAWFWTRVAKRTQNLGYFDGGFRKLIEKIETKILSLGGDIKKETKIEKIENNDQGKWLVNGEIFDGVVMTTPAPITEKILGKKNMFPEVDYLWGQTLILETNHKLINGYWMNILEKDWPFLVCVEHTNMIDKKNYGGHRIIYLGNYLPADDKQLKINKEELLTRYLPYLRKINRRFKKKWITNVYLFREPYSQPVFPTNYSKLLPDTRTPIKGLYLANMNLVYPFDRGTNYAVKMGQEVAKQLLTDLK